MIKKTKRKIRKRWHKFLLGVIKQLIKGKEIHFKKPFMLGYWTIISGTCPDDWQHDVVENKCYKISNGNFYFNWHIHTSLDNIDRYDFWKLLKNLVFNSNLKYKNRRTKMNEDKNQETVKEVADQSKPEAETTNTADAPKEETPEMNELNSDTPQEEKVDPEVEKQKKLEEERKTHTVAEGIFNVIKDITATKGKCFMDELEAELFARYETTFKFIRCFDKKRCGIIFPVLEALIEFKVISFNATNTNNPSFVCVEDTFAAAEYLPYADEAIKKHNHVQNLQKQA